ncbi:MAG TPA: hypothetical protein VJ549_09265 [Geothrix sp.]|nr:hypothetical protein [Geothrix sp.]
MARTPNYNFEKRQKDLARQKKKEEKLQKKAQKKEKAEEEAPAGSEGQHEDGQLPEA